MDAASTGLSRDRVRGDRAAHEKKSGGNVRRNSIRRSLFSVCLIPRVIRLIIAFASSGLFHQFPANSLFFPVEDRGGFLVVFPFFKFPDDAFFFHHPLKTFNGLFQHLVIIYDDMSQMNSPPFLPG
jgi:hypothetical protein